MSEFDLKYELLNLYKTNKYFITRPLLKKPSFESEYHEVAVDPDGKIRHLMTNQERDNKLKNFSAEILYELKANIKSGSILDIGCGPGWLLSDLDNAKWDKFGLDVSIVATNHAKKFGKIFNGTLENYNPKIKFDVVVMHHVIEHLEDPIKALMKVHSLLKNKGVLIIGTPNFDSAAAWRYGNKFRLLHDETHISLFTEDSMHRFLRDHGFKIYKVERPFFDTDFFNKENILKVLQKDIISPPMYGSVMTFFAIKE